MFEIFYNKKKSWQIRCWHLSKNSKHKLYTHNVYTNSWLEHVNFMIMVASGVTSGTERKDGIVKGYKELSIIPVMFYFLKNNSEANITNVNIW